MPSVSGNLSSVLLLITALVSVQIHAEDYYVDNIKGDDGAAGSLDSPVRQLKTAVNLLKAGDVLHVINNGVTAPYREALALDTSGSISDPITVIGSADGAPPLITGSLDWTDKSADGVMSWRRVEEDVYVLTGVPRPAAIWVGSTQIWQERGIGGLERRGGSSPGAYVEAGRWHYRDKTRELVYHLSSDESIDSLHLEAVVVKTLLKNAGIQNVEYSNLAFALSAKTAVRIHKQSHNIKMSGISVFGAEQNAIVVRASDAISITDCTIDHVGNNGIVIAGSKNNPASDTSVSDCRISNIERNDCITLHKDSKGNAIGAGHRLTGNVLSSCNEQGLDITSGSDVIAEANLTYGNGDSGIVIGHWVENVRVLNHLSVDDGRYASLLLNKADGVEVRNSCFIASEKHQLVLNNAKHIKLVENVFYHGAASKGSIIDIANKSQNIEFIDNVIVSTVPDRHLLIRYLQANDPMVSRLRFIGNRWSVLTDYKKRFYTRTFDRHDLSKHMRHYASKYDDTFSHGLMFPDLTEQFIANTCDLSAIPQNYRVWE